MYFENYRPGQLLRKRDDPLTDLSVIPSHPVQVSLQNRINNTRGTRLIYTIAILFTQHTISIDCTITQFYNRDYSPKRHHRDHVATKQIGVENIMRSIDRDSTLTRVIDVIDEPNGE